MKYKLLNKSVLLVLAVVGLGLAPTAQAEHATVFLDPLVTEVTTRQESPDLTPAQQRALSSALRTLNRNSRSVSGDLGQLANATTTLDRAFADDEAFFAAENDALNNFVGTAQADLDALIARASVGADGPPRQIANQIAQAEAALATASDGENTVKVRAKAVAFAVNKIRAANLIANRTLKAPASLEGSTVQISARNFGVTLDADGTYTVPGETEEDPPITRPWSYERTGANTGTVTLDVGDGATMVFDLTFRTPTSGTAIGEGVRGRFVVQPAGE